MTMTENTRNTPSGAVHHFDAHGPTAIPLTSRGLSELATRAMARLIDDNRARDLSPEARSCMRSPLATALATALCDDSTDTADLLVTDLIDAGLSVEDVCLDHLAPAARCLGEWWDADRLPFTDVTMATARIQAILRRLPKGRKAPRASAAKGAVFCAVPGEEHTLGVMMAADLFRRNGWDVGLLVGLEHGEILERLDRDDRSVIGLSCSGDHSVDALERLMIDLHTRRGDARILLSGQIAHDADALRRLPEPAAVVASMEEAEDFMHDLARSGAGAQGRSMANA